MTLILDKDSPLATKVQTRDGRRARLLCVDMKNPDYPIVAIHEEHSGGENVSSFAATGRYYSMDEDGLDLFNVPEPLDLRKRAWEIFEKRWGKGWVDGVIEKIEMAWKTSGTFPNPEDEILLGGEMLRLSGILAGLEEGRGDD